MATVCAIGVIIGAALVAYRNSLAVPFLLDDHPAIEANRSIRTLWPLSVPLSAPHDEAGTAGGRPFLNLTFAVSYAIGGLQVWSYHAINLVIHVAAALLLFGIVRRAPFPVKGRRKLLAALAVALIWSLHPLQTESVTYIAQRAESLVGMLYLLTIYAFIRGVDSPSPNGWYALVIIFCALGMASKEVMASAPLLLWLYDRTFISGTLCEAGRRRWWLYACLFATWLLLAYLVLQTAGHGGTTGFGTDVEWWAYALTQCEAIARYLRLAFWPSPLIFDYGIHVVRDPFAVAGQAGLLIALLVMTLVALRRWPAIGFAGAAFFLLLAPSSSIVPVATQTVAEHRMYLPLAVIATLFVACLYRLLDAPPATPDRTGQSPVPPIEQGHPVLSGANWRAAFVCFAVAAVLGVLTMRRNEDYRSERVLWEDTVAKLPTNARAHSNLAKALIDEGRRDEAFPHLVESVRLGPQLPAVHYNLGLILNDRGQKDEARSHYEMAVQLNPKYAEAHVNLGSLLMEAGQVAQAMPHLERAVELAPDLPEAQFALANGLMLSGKLPEAAERYAEALRLRPNYAMAHANFGSLLSRMGQPAQAAEQFERAIEIEPRYVWGYYNLGVALLKMGRPAEASARFAAALQVQPDFQPARDMLARLQAGAVGTPP